MKHESFYVTLPSNSSEANTLADFTTILSEPIQLEGEYEVALVQVTYPTQTEIEYGELKISNFKEIISIWSLNSDIECKDFYKRFTQIYDIQFKNSVVRVPSSFESKVKTWLGNNEQLFSQVNNQTLIYIYNRFTYEENMFNLLRGKRPQKIPQVKPDD